jgi:peptide/nickel transport system ATP-binding protein
MSLMPLLEVRSLTKTFAVGGFIRKRYLYAVDRVSFTVPGEPPTITALAGESGSGKTTISRLILGLMKPSGGEILFEGQPLAEILKCNRHAYFRRVQAVFQDPYQVYNPFYTVDRFLQTPIRKFHLASSEGEARSLIEGALEAVGLSGERVLGRYPHQLSGGEAQRVAIARALLLRPRLLIADEPVSMVDMSLRAGILNVLLKLKQDFGMSIIFVTHDLSVAYYLSDRIILLNRGRIVEMGDVEKVITRPLHPYVQELMRSIPVPNPRHRWPREKRGEPVVESFGRSAGCIFLERCPHPRAHCRDVAPPLLELEPDHFVACHAVHPDSEA